MDKQAIFMAREWVTKGLPTWDDCGFIPCPDAWENYLKGASLVQQKRPCHSGTYFK